MYKLQKIANIRNYPQIYKITFSMYIHMHLVARHYVVIDAHFFCTPASLRAF